MWNQILHGAHFVHDFNPVFLTVGGLSLYWYGLFYALGFLGLALWLSWRRHRLGWSMVEILDFSILFSLCVLIFGRGFEIVVYEWQYFSGRPDQLLNYWRGGLASHGLLLGGLIGTVLFSRLWHKPFLVAADEVVVPGALFLGLGRIGNFINGEIVGPRTEVWWAFKFPGIEGFRHPVPLYDGLKNLLIIPILLLVGRRHPSGRGMMFANFLFWYGFLRFLVDFFRDYGIEYGSITFGIGRGQYFNLAMAAVGIVLILWFRRRASSVKAKPSAQVTREAPPRSAVYVRAVLFMLILAFCLPIPSGWTQGLLQQYRQEQTTP